jgi:hypothetical protein
LRIPPLISEGIIVLESREPHLGELERRDVSDLVPGSFVYSSSGRAMFSLRVRDVQRAPPWKSMPKVLSISRRLPGPRG